MTTNLTLEQAMQFNAHEALLADLVAFCRDEGRPCFVGWPENILSEYLLFHHGNGSLVFTRQDGRIVGLAVGWQCNESEMERHWTPWNYAGDTFLFSQLVCRAPGALQSLVHAFQQRVPYWRHLNLKARRYKRGKLVTYPVSFIERLAK